MLQPTHRRFNSPFLLSCHYSSLKILQIVLLLALIDCLLPCLARREELVIKGDSTASKPAAVALILNEPSLANFTSAKDAYDYMVHQYMASWKTHEAEKGSIYNMYFI